MATVAPPETKEPEATRTGSLLGTALEIGGLSLITIAFAYTVFTLNLYEERFGPLDRPTMTSPSAAQDVNQVGAPDTASATSDEIDLNRDLSAARKALTDANGRADVLQHRIDELGKQLSAQNEALAAARSSAAQCQSELGSVKSQNLEIGRKLASQENCSLRVD